MILQCLFGCSLIFSFSFTVFRHKLIIFSHLFINSLIETLLMLIKSSKTDAVRTFKDVFNCCDEKGHKNMLLYEDYQLKQSQHRRSSKNTVNCSHSHHQQHFNSQLATNNHKFLLGQRRKVNEVTNYVHNFTFKASNFHRNSEGDANLNAQNIIKYNIGLSQKERKKTSLKHKKRNSQNQPFLDLSSLPNHKQFVKRPQLNLNLLENSKNGISLKLGENLPTVRSQFNNTNEYTQRSHL